MNEEARNPYPSEDVITVDLREFIRILRKWSKLIISMTVCLALLVMMVSTFVLEPVYQSKTLLMVTQATEKLQSVPTTPGTGEGELDSVVSTVSRIPVLTMSTYLGQLKSEALMIRVIERLRLLTTPASLSKMIEAQVVKDTNLIEVKVNHHNPVLACRIANTLSDEYVKMMTEKNKQQMSRSVEFLEEQKQATEKDLEKAERELKKLQGQARGIPVLEMEFNKKAESLAASTTRLQVARVELQQVEAALAELERSLVTTPKTIEVENLNEATGALTRSQEVNPLYVSVAQDVAKQRAAVAEKRGEIEGLQAMVGSLAVELDALQAELADKRMQQEKLQREVDRLRNTCETLAQKATETKIAKSIDLGDSSFVVISEASVPTTPVKPNKKLNVAVAVVLGLVVFTLLAFILEYLDNTIKTPDDVARELGVAVLGVIPKADANSSRQHAY